MKDFSYLIVILYQNFLELSIYGSQQAREKASPQQLASLHNFRSDSIEVPLLLRHSNSYEKTDNLIVI